VNGSKPMIDTVLNLLFNCPHRHLTRPFTPISKSGTAHGETYVVCLDCAKQFPYDLNTMRMGKAIVQSHDHCVVLPKMPRSRKTCQRHAAVSRSIPGSRLLGNSFPRRRRSARPALVRGWGRCVARGQGCHRAPQRETGGRVGPAGAREWCWHSRSGTKPAAACGSLLFS
jgi:hypothetical protein